MGIRKECDICGKIIDRDADNYFLKKWSQAQKKTMHIFDFCDKCVDEIHAMVFQKKHDIKLSKDTPDNELEELTPSLQEE